MHRYLPSLKSRSILGDDFFPIDNPWTSAPSTFTPEGTLPIKNSWNGISHWIRKFKGKGHLIQVVFLAAFFTVNCILNFTPLRLDIKSQKSRKKLSRASLKCSNCCIFVLSTECITKQWLNWNKPWPWIEVPDYSKKEDTSFKRGKHTDHSMLSFQYTQIEQIQLCMSTLGSLVIILGHPGLRPCCLVKDHKIWNRKILIHQSLVVTLAKSPLPCQNLNFWIWRWTGWTRSAQTCNSNILWFLELLISCKLIFYFYHLKKMRSLHFWLS